MDQESIEFKLIIKAVWWDKKPKVKVYLDQELIDDLTLDQELNEINFTKVLSDGDHSIQIEYYDKDNKQTVINELGEIVKDQLIDIKDIIIDGVQLGFLVWSKSYFEPNKNTKGYEDLESKMTNFATIGYNGTYTLPFQVPTYIWLLENL